MATRTERIGMFGELEIAAIHVLKDGPRLWFWAKFRTSGTQVKSHMLQLQVFCDGEKYPELLKPTIASPEIVVPAKMIRPGKWSVRVRLSLILENGSMDTLTFEEEILVP